MLAITPPKQPSSKKTLTPNLLPCKINHAGPIPTSSRHWNPQPSASSITSSSKDVPTGTQTSYFRGRKLHGTPLVLPQGYTGHVLQKTNMLLSQKPFVRLPGQQEEEDEEDIPAEIKTLEEIGTFEEIVVWGHESVPGEEDVYLRGLGEWVGFSERIHAFDRPGTGPPTKATTTAT